MKDKYHDQEFVEKYQDEVTYPTLSSVYAAFGVDADLSAYPKDYLFRTKEFAFEDRKHDLLSIKHYCYEPSFAPDGKSVVIVYFHANYDWWKERHKNYDVYKAEKDRLAQDIISRIEEHFPELSGKISTIDLATPITYERYCGAYKGSWMAFGTTPKGKQLMHSGRMKEISNLYMAGQWLMPPGGLPTAVITGKWAIQRICSINLGSRLRTLGLWNK